jgi:hypothetical protein
MTIYPRLYTEEEVIAHMEVAFESGYAAGVGKHPPDVPLDVRLLLLKVRERLAVKWALWWDGMDDREMEVGT